MSRVAKPERKAPVPPEEIESRINEYRRASFEHGAAPVVVYSPSQHPCPWPGCDLQIAGIEFKLDQLTETDKRLDCLKDFWLGEGLIAPCPSCGRLVSYGLRHKLAFHESSQVPHLEQGWHQVSNVVQARKS
jgi:hypothetical protein